MPLPSPIVDGDSFFTGVNMRLDPGQLKPGFCAFAKNKRFINGKAATRPGIKKMPWTNKVYDAWTNDAAKAYVTGDIVAYSGVSAEIEGVGATVSAIEDGTGRVYLKDVRSLNLLNGDFSSNANWVFSGMTAVNGDSIIPFIPGGNNTFSNVEDRMLSVFSMFRMAYAETAKLF